ncbi:hypothetical protein BU15DRAFT_60658 [Melanogaster broomeanus]|nr:hypothetical protein BU15DRAFT_60658 [Melanogaster broomeanus]
MKLQQKQLRQTSLSCLKVCTALRQKAKAKFPMASTTPHAAGKAPMYPPSTPANPQFTSTVGLKPNSFSLHSEASATSQALNSIMGSMRLHTLFHVTPQECHHHPSATSLYVVCSGIQVLSNKLDERKEYQMKSNLKECLDGFDADYRELKVSSAVLKNECYNMKKQAAPPSAGGKEEQD